MPPITRRKMNLGKEEQAKESKRLLERNDLFGVPREEVSEIVSRKTVSSSKLKLKGIIDILLLLRDSSGAVPVEIKYTDNPEANLSRKKQLFAYILLCEEALNLKCPYGILYFPDQNRSIRLTATEGDKTSVLKDIEEISRMFKTETLPRKAAEWKCNYCEVKRYCWT